jgi:hypothetical protein
MEGDDENKRNDCNGDNEADNDKGYNAGQALNVVSSYRKHQVARHGLLLTYTTECFFCRCTLNLTTLRQVLSECFSFLTNIILPDLHTCIHLSSNDGTCFWLTLSLNKELSKLKQNKKLGEKRN